jgi:uncharacterized LabA/DUF88 family protein/cold shock CspA family protein
MTVKKQNGLTRIGVFYDGNYFLHVSNFYNYSHERKSRISIDGLHRFIRSQVAQHENTDERLCQIVDAHYFRGRLNASDASKQGNTLYNDRVFDDILSSEGVTTHYLPVRNYGGIRHEKGIDVLLALEAFELAMYKEFNVIVLIASDGDYVPLVRKLNSLGTRVMVLSWDFDYTNDYNKQMTTRTSQELLEEVSYPIAMHEIIDNRLKRNDPMVGNLFVPHKEKVPENPVFVSEDDEIYTDIGEIFSINKGYGFIKHPRFPKNLFFHHQSTVGIDFNDLKPNDLVQFDLGTNDKGDTFAINVQLVEQEVDMEQPI